MLISTKAWLTLKIFVIFILKALFFKSTSNGKTTPTMTKQHQLFT
jgi:hypothetical protein